MIINTNNKNTKYTVQGDLHSTEFGNSDLVAACGKGDVQCVRRILESGLNPNFRTAEGTTLLMLASRDGHIGVVEALLTHKADVDMPDNDGRTALTMAACNGHTEVVQELLVNGADVDMRDTWGSTALRLAACHGLKEIVKPLLSNRVCARLRYEDECIALMLAARNGYTEIVKALLANRASVDKQTKDGWTALMLASVNGHTDVVKALLANGTEVDMRDTWGWTALRLAISNGHTDIVKALLANGASVDMQDEYGWTALMFAASAGHTDIVKELLANGASVDKQTRDGWTALALAVDYGHTDIVKELLANGASVDKQTRDGWTALILAAGAGHTDIVKELLANGASVDKQTRNGWTALILAAGRGHKEITKELLECGANICVIAHDGTNALHILRQRAFPGYAQIKTGVASVPELKEYNDFYRRVKNVCHMYSIDGKSRFEAARYDIVFKGLGMRDNYYSSIFAKNVSLFSENTKDKAAQKALSNICRMLEEHTVSTHVSTDELAKRCAQGTPILVSGGYNVHHMVYCFWNTHCILVNRGRGFSFRKPIEIFPIEEKKCTDPAFFKGLLSEIRRIQSGPEAEFKKFVDDEFQKSYYLPKTAVELLLEEMLALPRQTVGNCGFAGTEGAVFALFALEALHAKGLLNQGECDEVRQGEIREIVKQQREIFDEFSAFLRARYREKYLTKVPPERQEAHIFYTLSPVHGVTSVVKELLKTIGLSAKTAFKKVFSRLTISSRTQHGLI